MIRKIAKWGASSAKHATRRERSEIACKKILLVLILLLPCACATTSSRLQGISDDAPVAKVRVGDRIEGSFHEDSRRNFKDGSPRHLFELIGSAGTAVEIRAFSTDLDSTLTLYTPDGELLAFKESTAEGILDTRLQTFLPKSGNYLLVVSGSNATQTGKYTLGIRGLAFTEEGALDIPSRITGLLHAGDEAMIVRNTFVDRFLLHIEKTKTIVAEMGSEEVDAYLFLTDSRGGVILAENDDAHSGTTDARVIKELRPGTYQLLATTYQPESQGLYELSVRELKVVDGGALAVPGEATGRLRDADPIRPPRGTPYHSYDLEVEKNETVIIDMTSNDLDAYLYLYAINDAGKILLEENDDRADGGTDARIVRELTPGAYRIVATSYRPNETGIYDLSTQVVSLADSFNLSVPGQGIWFLGGSDSQPRGARGVLQGRHTLIIEEQATIQIDMRSDCFDAYLIVLAGDGSTVLAENDDANNQTTHARLILHVQPGRYQLAATSFRPGEEGLYGLEITEVDPATPGAMRIGAP